MSSRHFLEGGSHVKRMSKERPGLRTLEEAQFIINAENLNGAALSNDLKRWSDSALEAEIKRIETAIQSWAESRDLWFDCGFTTYLDHVDGEPPEPPVVSILTFEGDLYHVLSGEDSLGYEVEFRNLLGDLGYHYENINGVSAEIYAEDAELSVAFSSYFQWQWVCSLVREDTADVYEELYRHFAQKPEDLQRLHWRDFEVLLFRIFQSQGFVAELGPGRGDEGVDLRLWQRDPIGDVLTLVQAKRYANRNKIDLTQVAALYGIQQVESADRSLFVTTSSYLPVARRFAGRTSGALQLAERDDIVKWCEKATSGVIIDKSSLIAPAAVSRIIADVANRHDARVLHATWGRNMVMNKFALVIKESKHAALLMSLECNNISDDGYGQRGLEIPKLDWTTGARLNSECVWRAKRTVKDGRVSYWDGNNLYCSWNGKPAHFDYMD